MKLQEALEQLRTKFGGEITPQEEEIYYRVKLRYLLDDIEYYLINSQEYENEEDCEMSEKDEAIFAEYLEAILNQYNDALDYDWRSALYEVISNFKERYIRGGNNGR